MQNGNILITVSQPDFGLDALSLCRDESLPLSGVENDVNPYVLENEKNRVTSN